MNFMICILYPAYEDKDKDKDNDNDNNNYYNKSNDKSNDKSDKHNTVTDLKSMLIEMLLFFFCSSADILIVYLNAS